MMYSLDYYFSIFLFTLNVFAIGFVAGMICYRGLHAGKWSLEKLYRHEWRLRGYRRGS
jgi:hypothetical protein